MAALLVSADLHVVTAAATRVNIVLQVQALEGEGDGVPASRIQLPGLQHVSVTHVRTLINHVHLFIVMGMGV